MKSSQSGKKRSRRLLALVGFFILAIFFSLQGFLTSMIAPIASPLVSFGTWISERVFWWHQIGDLDSEDLELLYQQREDLLIDRVEFERLQEENSQLREVLDFVERTSISHISAQILSKSISNSVSRFVIDVGSADGVISGSAVVVGEGIFIGKVTELGKYSSTVTTITDPTHSVAVSLLNESRTIGVATGSVGDLMTIELIPIDEQIEQNDLVVTSGLEAPIPSGLLVGIINTVIQETGAPFQKAIMEPLGDIRRISTVLVLIPSDEDS
ncbi:rod shape-determining protein MreC [Candidatus Uhrbacteria bacterium]|nr:rod shape-determining protein MreC [Candidatus Uhrbacteria bacterium]